MNIRGDGNHDGKFRIQKGQGLTQAIAGELGLNAEQCKKLGSVWFETIKIAEKEGAFNNGTIFNSNDILQVDDEFEFSTEAWNLILEKVNDKLGTSFEKVKVVADEPEPTNEEAIAAAESLPNSAAFFGTGLTALTLGRAIISSKYRNAIKDKIAKLSKEQQAEYKKACARYDKAKAEKSRLSSQISKEQRAERLNRSKLNVVQAKAELDAQNKILKEHSGYQKINKDLTRLDVLEKKINAGKTLTKQEAEELKNLKANEKQLRAEKQNLEKSRDAAKKKLDYAHKQYQKTKYENKIEASKEEIVKARNEVAAEKRTLKNNAEFKANEKELKSVNKQIKSLESKSKLTNAQRQELNKLTHRKMELLKERETKFPKLAAAEKKLLNVNGKLATTEITGVKSMSTKDATAKSLKASKKGKIYKLKWQKMTSANKKLASATLKKFASGSGFKTGMKVLNSVGKVAKPLAIAVSGYTIWDAYQTGGKKKAVRQTAEVATAATGAWAGAKGGAAAGAAIGTFVGGPVGAAVGGFAGGVAGAVAGWWAGEKVYDSAEKRVLPNETPLNQNLTQEDVEITFNSEEEMQEFIKQHPEFAGAFEEA